MEYDPKIPAALCRTVKETPLPAEALAKTSWQQRLPGTPPGMLLPADAVVFQPGDPMIAGGIFTGPGIFVHQETFARTFFWVMPWELPHYDLWRCTQWAGFELLLSQADQHLSYLRFLPARHQLADHGHQLMTIHLGEWDAIPCDCALLSAATGGGHGYLLIAFQPGEELPTDALRQLWQWLGSGAS